jgi:broad specificity phosphatase PhoE
MSEDSSTSSHVAQRLMLLLRHGEIASHRGDVPVTEAGLVFAKEIGCRLGVREGRLRVVSGQTQRARQTAQAIADGARSAGAEVAGPRIAFAIRNPDIYVAGERVEFVSSAEDLAVQVDGLGQEKAAAVPFFQDFFAAPDRIGWWLRHPNPPGEDAATVAHRVMNFAASLADRPDAELTVAVTNSPVLRACALELLGEDPGEPAWIAGLAVEIRPDRSVRVTLLPEAP